MIKVCQQCQKELSKYGKLFCSLSCSASYNNIRKIKKVLPTVICKSCNKPYQLKKNRYGIYCSNKCHGKAKNQNFVERWLIGDLVGWSGKTRGLKPFIRTWLKETRGSACSRCGWDKTHPIDNKSLTEINHIDGDAENCSPSNLEILCPNCHSMTLNFKARNKSSKRNRKASVA